MFRDTTHGAALRHLPSRHHATNRAGMWSALLAATCAGWLHQLTATRHDGQMVGHGARGGQAMIATLRRRLANPRPPPAPRPRSHPAQTRLGNP